MATAWINGRFYLGDRQFAPAVSTDRGRFTLIGDRASVLAASEEVVDCGGRTVVPGFNDSHQHLLSTGECLRSVQLLGSTSVSEIISRGRAFLTRTRPEKGTVITGQGWNQDDFKGEKRFLNRHDLDRISTEHPIIFDRACVHLTVCNTLALKLAGLWGGAPAQSGLVELDRDGHPTGLLREQAMTELRGKLIPPPDEREITRRILSAMKYESGFGITSVQTMDRCPGGPGQALSIYRRLAESGDAALRVTEQILFEQPEALGAFMESPCARTPDTDWVKCGPIKCFLDGSLGGRTAWMRSDYADQPGNRGVCTLSPELFKRLASSANALGKGIIAHAIGDRAIEAALDVLEPLSEEGGNSRRNGIVHCQITDKELLDRFQRSGTLAYVQPIFLRSDWRIADNRVGSVKAATSYAFRTMDRLGIPVSFGTDSPVESPNPFENLYCAVTRQDLEGNPAGGWYPEEKTDIYEAVGHYTLGSAFAEDTERYKGRIKEGYLADMAVLSHDIFTGDPEDIRECKSVITVAGGKIISTRE